MSILDTIACRIFGKTILQMRCRSGQSWKGGFWTSWVDYDAWGMPYGEDKSGFPVQLHKDGTTAYHWFDGTEWKHIAGPVVKFPKGIS